MLLFMKFKWISILFSLFLFIFTFGYTYIHHKGFNKGLDFSGGVKILYLFKNSKINLNNLRKILPNELDIQINEVSEDGVLLYYFEISVRSMELLDQKLEKDKEILLKYNIPHDYSGWIQYHILEHFSLLESTNSIEEVSLNFVGPTVGKYLLYSSVRLLLITLILLTVYITFRFRFSYALGATIALLHDLLIIGGLIGFFQITISIPVIAAVLTIMGYSINDTIVIFDRIRENHEKIENIAIVPLIDRSITESLSRTIITSFTTLLVVGSIYVISGETLKQMSLVLILGVIIGTYSSTFIASPVLIFWDRFIKKF